MTPIQQNAEISKEIERLIDQNFDETEKFEWKKEINNNSDSIVFSIASFSNSLDGGYIIVGILDTKNSNKKSGLERVCGFTYDNEVGKLITEKCKKLTSTPFFEIQWITINHKQCLCILIKPSSVPIGEIDQNGWIKFAKRGNQTKIPMSIQDISLGFQDNTRIENIRKLFIVSLKSYIDWENNMLGALDNTYFPLSTALYKNFDLFSEIVNISDLYNLIVIVDCIDYFEKRYFQSIYAPALSGKDSIIIMLKNEISNRNLTSLAQILISRYKGEIYIQPNYCSE